MTIDPPIPISSSNLSHVWGRCLLTVMDYPLGKVPPIVVTFQSDGANVPTEDPIIREAVDAELRRAELYSCDVSATMIFPFQAWVRKGRPDATTFHRYCIDRFLPRLKKLNKINVKGTYFERMMAYQGVNKRGEITVTDQLGFVLKCWQRRERSGRRPRTAALQVACLDPAKDHIGSPRQGFPCLQQVGFGVDKDNNLVVNAYYPSQYVFDRAYGNYLGLSYLGYFMAKEMGIRFAQLNGFIGEPKLGGEGVTKSFLGNLRSIVQSRVVDHSSVE